MKGTIFQSLRFSFREFKTSLITILKVKHDSPGSTFYGTRSPWAPDGTSIIWPYGRKLARAQRHGSCLYGPFVGTQALNFEDAFVTVHKTKHRDQQVDRQACFLKAGQAKTSKQKNKRPGKGGGFELRSSFRFKFPAPGKLTMVKRLQILHPSDISVVRKNVHSPSLSGKYQYRDHFEEI